MGMDGTAELVSRRGQVADRIRTLEQASPRQRQRPAPPKLAPGPSALPMFLQGTRDRCIRHGRKPATKDMVEQSRSGAYVPTGMTTRRQVEATSQWVVAKKSKAAKASDACPDCVTELGIRRREAIQTVMRPTDGSQEVSYPRQVVAAVEPQSPMIAPKAMHANGSSGVSSTWMPWRRDASGSAMPPSQQPTPLGRLAQQHPPQRLRDVSNSSTDESGDLVVAQDLGAGLDAAIFERRGELERVIVNSRLGDSMMNVLQRLSKELLSVSQELAFAGRDSRGGAAQPDQPRSAVFGASGSVKKHHSVTDLMSLIDNAIDSVRPEHAEELRNVVGPFATPYTRAPGAPRNLENAQWQLVPSVQYPDDDEYRSFAAHPLTSSAETIAEAVKWTQPTAAATLSPYSHTASRRTGMTLPMPLPPSKYTRAPQAPRNLEHAQLQSSPAMQMPDDDDFRAFAANPVISSLDSIAEAVRQIQPAAALTATPYSHTAHRRTGMADVAAALPPTVYSRAPQAPRNLEHA